LKTWNMDMDSFKWCIWYSYLKYSFK